MASLTKIDKLYLEQYFEMEKGYVLDFSNRAFTAFVFKHTELDIYSDKYSFFGDSKANRLRAFWQEESDVIVAKLTELLLDCKSKEKTNPELHNKCLEIVKRLETRAALEQNNAISQSRKLYDLSLDKWHTLHTALLLESDPVRKMQLEVSIEETKQKCIDFAKLLGEPCPLVTLDT